MSHVMPSESQVRQRISEIGTTFKVGELHYLPNGSDDEKYRMAFMYQLLICGRISEVCGRYAPRGTDVIEVDYNGEPAALFAVKTAKRNGKLRPVALPLDPKYEPWTRPVLEYFKRAGNDYPFKFSDKWQTSTDYAMGVARRTFEGYEWPMIEYTKAAKVPYDKTQVITSRFGNDGYEEYLVELEPGLRRWTSDPVVVKVSEKVHDRWKRMTSHALRKRRAVTLSIDYGFDGYDLACYGGWTEKSQVDAQPGALKYYLHVDIQESRELMKMIYEMAKRYFHKLLLPYSEVIKNGK